MDNIIIQMEDQNVRNTDVAIEENKFHLLNMSMRHNSNHIIVVKKLICIIYIHLISFILIDIASFCILYHIVIINNFIEYNITNTTNITVTNLNNIIQKIDDIQIINTLVIIFIIVSIVGTISYLTLLHK